MSSKIITALTTLDYKDLAIRAGWTFLQSFLAVLLFTSDSFIDLIFTGDFTGAWGVALTLLVAATAAGLSALKTLVVSFVIELRSRAK